MGRSLIRNLIDTNVWIDALAGNLAKKAFMKFTVKAEWAGYSAITRLELFGFPKLTENEEAKITEMLNAFNEIPVNSSIIDCAIQIRKKAKIKIPDAIIGASALVLDCNLITRNVSDFKSIDGLKVINPFAE
jgi:predicted nucleic acid-binding protein